MNILDKIHYDIYSFTIKDWKNTSLIVDQFNNKCFSLFLKELINNTIDKTKYFFNYEVIEVLENSTLKIEDKERLNDSLFKAYYEKTSFSSLEFSKKITEYLSKKYLFINSLRPQGWESFILLIEKNKNNNINLNNYYSNISNERSKIFYGENLEKNDNFYDNISIYLTAYKKINHGIQPFENFIESVVKYTAEINSINNTNNIIDKIINNNKYENDELYINYLNFKNSKLVFEVDLENQKKKEDITKILKKISKN